MKSITIGNDTMVDAIRIRAEPIISVGDIPTDKKVWVRTASKGWATIMQGVLVDVDISTIDEVIQNAATELEQNNPTLKFPYALILEPINE